MANTDKRTIYEWVCITCGKHILSLNEKQFEFNKETHLRSHNKDTKEDK